MRLIVARLIDTSWLPTTTLGKQGKQKPCPNRRSQLYYFFTICQAINKSFGCWRLQGGKLGQMGRLRGSL